MRIAKKALRKWGYEGGLALSDSKMLSKVSVIEEGRDKSRSETGY